MKVVLASALYPPDVAPSAAYIKELAARLHAAGHEVVAVVYGALPEAVPGVTIVGVDKRHALVRRLWAYTRALRRAAHKADIVIAENGPSVELALVALNRPYVLHWGDQAAHARAHGARKWLEHWVARRAKAIIADMPLPRPEVLPFGPPPDFAAYERSWSNHLEELQKQLSHATH